MRTHVVLAVVLLDPLGLSGQGAPGKNLTVDVTVTSIAFRGDTGIVTYQLLNQSNSAEQVFRFTVDAPASPVRVTRPAPTSDWRTSSQYRTRPVAGWTVLGDELMPGQQSPALVYEAVGLPAPVTFWYRGYFPPTPLGPADTVPVVAPSDPLAQNSVAGTGVGITPFPVAQSGADLVLRLRGLLDQTCGSGLNWITSPAVCSGLAAQLDSASQALASADTTGARAQIQNFITALSGQHGSGLPVNDSAFWLLKANADYILSRRL
jgi:hypothetical protein